MLVSRRFLKVATGVGAATLLCKGLAAAQQLMLARTLGATEMADAFFLAQVLPVLLSGLLYNALSANVVVVLAGLPSSVNRAALLSGLLLQVAACMLLVVLLVFLGSMLFYTGSAGGGANTLWQRAAQFQLPLLPILFFQPIAGLAAGALQSNGNIAASPLSMSLPYLFGVIGLAFTRDGSPYPLALGLVSGSVLQGLSLCLALHFAGTQWAKPIFGNGRQLFKLVLPGLGCNAISTLYLVSDRSFAASLGVGQVAAISYIYSIVTMPTQILVNTVVSVSMPHWAKLTGNRSEFADSLGRALGLLLLAVVPLALCLHFAASPISSILLGSSAFVQSKRDEIAALLGSFALASIGFALKDTLAAALISQRKPAHALAGGFFSLLVAWAVRTSLPGDLGLRAAAIATTIGLFTAAGVAMWSVANREWLGNLWARVRIAIVPAFPAIVAGNGITTPEASAAVAALVYGLFVLGSMRCWDWTPANTRHIEG